MRSLFALPALSGFDLIRTGDDRRCRRLAVRGFDAEDLDLTVVAGQLVVSGMNGAFRRVFTLSRHVEISRADLRNSLLEIDLVREPPRELLPRRIPIGRADRAAVPAPRERLFDGLQRWMRGLWRPGQAVAQLTCP